MQQAARPDGPAFLLVDCMVRLSRSFGRPLSAAEIRAAAGTDRIGVEAALRAALRLGLKAKRLAAESSALAGLPPPFVVIGPGGAAQLALGREEGRLTLWDPQSDSERQATVEETAANAQELLVLRPSQAAAREGGWRRTFLLKLRSIMAEVAIASLAINLLALAAPLFAMTVYNKVIGQRALATLDVLAVGMLVVILFETSLRALRGYVSAHTAARLDAYLGGEVLHHMLALPYKQFETTTTGVLSERLNQLEVLRNFFAGQLPLLIVDLAFVALFLGVLAYIHPTMLAATLGALPLIAAVPLAAHRLQRVTIEQAFSARAAKATALAETVGNALTIKSLGLEPEVEKRWDARLALAAWTGFRSANFGNVARAAAGCMSALLSLGLLFLGARLVIAGELSIGALIAGTILAQRAVAPIGALASGWQGLQEVAAAFRRIDGLMALQSERGERTMSAPGGGSLVMEQVSFSFGAERPVLRDVTLTAEPGQFLGVIGPSGSGKSTLLKLLQGLYQPTSGRVIIDGTDLAHLSPESVRQQFGVVPQEVQLFSGTISDNIAFAVPGKDPERIVAVAKFVGAHDFIQRLPAGYDTVLGERGLGLSFGQRQLITIARALMRNPRTILLDEATSALDPATEEAFLRNLKRAARGRTVVLVTHRIAPLSFCDRVALMVDGEIVRIGPPAEIVAYARAELAEAAPK
ncbi:MAG TPA: peptidase domain-containing ABC transporter [Methylomirabilota bacterium]|jgi:ATP-binding cassette, subfamily B, bacterial HlyB/CyaB|nr:peptidase domain-containing ABC transporter [Methylomirabilota bacterium]